MDAMEIALSAAFMGLGFARGRTAGALRKGDSAPFVGGTITELAELASAAARLEQMYAQLPVEIQDQACGVWAYEVAEPFGYWYGTETYGGLLTDEASCRAKLDELVVAFFTQDLESPADVEAQIRSSLETVEKNWFPPLPPKY